MNKRLKKYSIWLCALVIATGVFVLLGWQFDIAIFKQPLPGKAAMNPMSAVAFIFCGSALLLLLQKQENKQLPSIAKILAVLVSLIGALRLIAVFNFYDAGIDRLLFSGKMAANLFDGKLNSMAPNTAFNFLLAGFPLLFLSNKKIVISQWLSLLTAFIALLTIIGYMYGVTAFYGVLSYFPMAVHTAGCFLILSTAILFARSDKGFMTEITSPYGGGKAARLLLPMAVFVPIVVGLFRLYGERMGWYSTPFGSALFTTIIIIVFGFLIWETVASINKSEMARAHEIAERKKIEEEIKKNNLFLETIFDNIPNMIFVKEGNELRFAGINKAGEQLLGLSRQELIGKTDYDFFPQEQADFFSAKDREVFTGKNAIDITEEKITTKQGERWLHTKKIPVAGGNGMPLYIVGISEDITEKKSASDKLQQANRHILDLYNNAPCSYHSVDASGIFIDMNDTGLKWLGYRREEVIGKLRFDDLITPESKEKLQHKFHELKQVGFLNDLEFEVIRKDGTAFPAILSSTALYDEQGNFLRSRSTVFDYTERKILNDKITQFNRELEKKVEEKTNELMKAELHFREILDNLMEGAQIVGFDWRYKYVNDTFVKHANYSRVELLGHTVMEKFPGIEQTKIFEVYQQCMNERIPMQLENEFTFPDGTIGWFDLSFQPVPEGVFILSMDITKRKKVEEDIRQSQERYFTLMNSVDGIVWEADAKTFEFNFVSKQAERLLGYPVEQWTSQPTFWADHIYKDDRNWAVDYCVQCTLEKKSHEFEYRMVAADGQIIWLRDIVSVQVENNEAVKLKGIMIDITDQKIDELLLKQLNEALEKRAAELKVSNTELERFAYVASHDLQEPLRMVSSFMDLLEKRMNGQLDETTQQYIHYAVDGAERMKTLIQALLQYSRVGTNKEDFTSTDLNEVMQYTTRVLKEDIQKSRAVVTVKPMPVIPANKTLISQLFVNLVNNALKYQGDKEPEIEVGCTGNPDKWIFYVKDNGIGIDPKFFDKIFIIFQRLHNRKEYSGTGIGLAICKKIIEIHNGKIWVKSEPGKGSSFYFSIPKQNA